VADAGVKAKKQHAQVMEAKKHAKAKIKKALAKVAEQKQHVTESKDEKIKHIEKKQPKKVRPMGSSRCFMLMLDTPEEMVLQVDPLDKYRPRKTGVYNVFLAHNMKDKPLNDPQRKHQLWYYNAKRRALLSRKFPSKGLFEGFNKNLIVFKYRGLKNQVWTFDMTHHEWFNNFSRRGLQVEEAAIAHPKDGQNVVTDKINWKDKRQRFIVKPCK